MTFFRLQLRIWPHQEYTENMLVGGLHFDLKKSHVSVIFERTADKSWLIEVSQSAMDQLCQYVDFIAELVYQLCQYVWWFSMLSLLWHLALVIDWLWSVDKDDVFFFLLHFIFVKTPSCVKRIRQVENFSIGTQTNCFTDGIKFYTQFCLESTLHNVSVQFLGLKLRLCKNKR